MPGRILHELASRDRKDGRVTVPPQGLGPLPVRRRVSDARKDAHIRGLSGAWHEMCGLKPRQDALYMFAYPNRHV